MIALVVTLSIGFLIGAAVAGLAVFIFLRTPNRK